MHKTQNKLEPETVVKKYVDFIYHAQDNNLSPTVAKGGLNVSQNKARIGQLVQLIN